MASPTELRTTIQEWVDVEKVRSLELSKWQQERQLLGDLKSVLLVDIEKMESRIADAEERMSAADKERDELVKKELRMEWERETVLQFLSETKPWLLSLKNQLPSPLQDSLTVPYGKLETLPELAIAERMQASLAIISAVRTFDSKITLVEEIRENKVIQTVYVGMACAYYVGADDAGVGYPGEEGWSWSKRPELAGPISEFIHILDGETFDAKFINLPVVIREGRP